MEFLLTGARGYLGACVAAEAQARGHTAICPDQRLEALAPASLEAGLVIHCAGVLRARLNDHQRSNVAAAEALLAALRQPSRLIWISSRAVYAPSSVADPGLISETHPLGPSESYGVSKLAGEELLRASGHTWCIVRPSLLIGAGIGQAGPAFVSQAFARMARGETIRLAEPAPMHDWLAVRDLAAWLLDLAEADAFENQTYNAAGPPRSLANTFEAYREVLRRHLGREAQIERIPATQPEAPLLDSSKLQARLPRRLSTDREIAEGLARLMEA